MMRISNYVFSFILCAVISLAVPALAQTQIECLGVIAQSGKLDCGTPQAGLADELVVKLKVPGGTIIDPTKIVLVLDGQPIPGLTGTVYRTAEKALVFRLVRNGENSDRWQPLLSKPTAMTRAVAVDLWEDMPAKGTAPKEISWDASEPRRTFALKLMTPWSLLAGGLAVLLVLVLVWASATRTNILKDSLLPQLPPAKQTFSLGRTQMAFWFTLVFGSYVFLFVLLRDQNTITPQALMLMGLSAATAVFAVAIDATKDTLIGVANETLRAIGIKSFDDVRSLEVELATINAKLKADPTNTSLLLDLQDRQNKLQLWRDLTARFVSGGLYADLLTDINGPALHRLQIVVWTLTLGTVFLIDVYCTLAMPEFSATLLALMGVTSAGYLGFKFPEKQN